MKKPDPKAIEAAAVLLKGHGLDLLFGTSMWTLFNRKNLALLGDQGGQLGIPATRLFFSHLLMTMCRISETYKRFKYLLPKNSKEILRSISHYVRDNRIDDFRNKVIGHIWDNDTDRPLTPEEIDERISRIVGNKAQFFANILNLNDATDITTLVGKMRFCEAELRQLINKGHHED